MDTTDSDLDLDGTSRSYSVHCQLYTSTPVSNRIAFHAPPVLNMDSPVEGSIQELNETSIEAWNPPICKPCSRNLFDSFSSVAWTPPVREMLSSKKEFDSHAAVPFSTDFCRAQRALYYDHRERAGQEPQKCLSIIIDGMYQNKTNLPHLVRKNKSACSMWVMRTHVTGALAHGRRSFAFIDLHLWPQDSNLSANILLQILLQQATCGKLPPTLYLQLDNCYRENKNQSFFGFVALLVHYKVFKEVHTTRCMCGSHR